MPGFECAFLKPVPKNLKCLLCILPCRRTVWISSCGHKFCENCIDNYLRSGIFVCPEDKISLDYAKIYPDPTTDRKILSLLAKCPNCNHGCSWIGSLSAFQSHLEVCVFDLMDCPNLCSSKIFRQSASEHLLSNCSKRNLPCEHCAGVFTHDKIEHHSNHCPQELIYCERKCGQQLQRQFLQNHTMNECAKRQLACPHGCGKEISYDTLGGHFLNCPRFPLKCPLGCSAQPIPRGDVAEHLRVDCPERLAIACPMRDIGCHFKGSQTAIDQHSNGSQDSHFKLLSEVLLKQRTKIALLTAALQHVQASHDGRLLWKISGVSSKFQLAKVTPGFEIQSPVFYTSKYGYKLQASVFLNGNGQGEGTHVSVYIKVTAGEYDALLAWPFRLPVTFTLLDQSADLDKRVHVKESFTPDPLCKTFHRPLKSCRMLGFGHAKFISHDMLKRRNYIREDVFFIQIETDGNNSSHSNFV